MNTGRFTTAYARMLAQLASGMTGYTVEFSAAVSTAAVYVAKKHVIVNAQWVGMPADAFIGILLHEVNGHGKRTAVDLFASCRGQGHKSMVNIVEDIRIELGVHSDWPGAKRLLAATLDYVLGQLPARMSAENRESKAQIVAMSALYWGRRNVLGNPRAEDFAQQAKDAFLAHPQLGRVKWAELERLVRSIAMLPRGLDGSLAVIPIADALLALAADDDGDADGKAEGRGNADPGDVTASERDNEGKADANGDAENDEDPDGNGKTDATGADGETGGNTDGESDGKGRAGADTDADADGKSDGKSDGKGKAAANGDAEADGDASGNTGADGETGGNTDGESDGKGRAGADTDADADGKSDGKSDGKGKAAANGDAEADGDASGNPGGKGKGNGSSADDETIEGADLGELLARALGQIRLSPTERISTQRLESLASNESALMPFQDHWKHSDVSEHSAFVPMVASALEPLSELFNDMTYRSKGSYSSIGTSLNVERAAKAGVHNYEVFEKLTYGEGLDTCLGLLIDHSGSMFSPIASGIGSSVLRSMAATSCVAAGIINLCDEFDVPRAVVGFADDGHLVLGFDEPLKRDTPLGASLGSTELLAGLAGILPMLVTRPESKKILVIITDGDTSDPDGAQEALSARFLATLGIQVLYFQMGCNTRLGVHLEQTGHCVARADTLSELCSRIPLAIAKAINGTTYMDQ